MISSVSDSDLDPDLDAPNPHTRTAQITLVVTVAFLAWGIAALLYAVTHRRASNLFSGVTGFLVIGGLVVGCVGVLLPLLYAAARADARRVELFRREFRAGHYLVRWRYSRESWRAFRAAVAADEVRESRKLDRALTILGAGGLLIALIILIVPRDLIGAGAWPISGVTAFLGAVCLAGIPFAALHHRRTRAALERPHDSIVSTIGAYANGKWLMWGTFQHTLHDARVIGGADGQPPMLEISIRYAKNNFPERILVPAGDEELAHRVAAAIKQAPAAQSGGGAERLTNILRGVSPYRTYR
jgi:hypothetical protein